MILLVAGWIAAGWVRRGLRRALMRLPGADATVSAVLSNLARYTILVLVLIAILAQFGVQTASILAVLGTAGLAIGLALQGTLSNIAAGLMLLFLRPFSVGDYIDAEGIAGTVDEVGLFNTELTTFDGVYRAVPNSQIWSRAILNYSRLPTRRLDLVIGVDYGDDLERALSEILQCFRPGPRSWLAGVLSRRIDRIVFAATKADHLHHTSHDRLEAILARLTDRAIRRAEFAGADVKVIAMAAVRATREAEARHDGDTLPCIVGYPIAGETIDGRTFDGEQEFAVFPGDLPADPERVFVRTGDAAADAGAGLSFVRFRPPKIEAGTAGAGPALPHIRLDRALDFLLGDRL